MHYVVQKITIVVLKHKKLREAAIEHTQFFFLI